MKASALDYRTAKRIALEEIVKAHPDAPMPDEIRFTNDEHGFVLRVGVDRDGVRVNLQRVIGWSVVKTSADAVRIATRQTIEGLLRHAD